jgi:hypothetical protein
MKPDQIFAFFVKLLPFVIAMTVVLGLFFFTRWNRQGCLKHITTAAPLV